MSRNIRKLVSNDPTMPELPKLSLRICGGDKVGITGRKWRERIQSRNMQKQL